MYQTLRRVFTAGFQVLSSAITGVYEDRELSLRHRPEPTVNEESRREMAEGITEEPAILGEKVINVEDQSEYALVIDGKTLAMVLENDIKYLFLAVALSSIVNLSFVADVPLLKKQL